MKYSSSKETHRTQLQKWWVLTEELWEEQLLGCFVPEVFLKIVATAAKELLHVAPYVMKQRTELTAVLNV